MTANLQEASLLWIPSSLESQEEWDLRAKQATEANSAVMDFCDGIISLDDCFQIIEATECDIDDYIDNFAENLRMFGV